MRRSRRSSHWKIQRLMDSHGAHTAGSSCCATSWSWALHAPVMQVPKCCAASALVHTHSTLPLVCVVAARYDVSSQTADKGGLGARALRSSRDLQGLANDECCDFFRTCDGALGRERRVRGLHAGDLKGDGGEGEREGVLHGHGQGQVRDVVARGLSEGERMDGRKLWDKRGGGVERKRARIYSDVRQPRSAM